MSAERKRILTVNAGSTSLKLECYELEPGPYAVGVPEIALSMVQVGPQDAESALTQASQTPLDAVAHRFVRVPDGMPPVFPLDVAALNSIEASAADAPLHDASALAAVEMLTLLHPSVPQFGVSDSAFHRTMPEAATTYALPRELTGSGLRRIGYHGLSHEYAAHRGSALVGFDVWHARVITAHIGGGSSLCAVVNGTSLDTTMGYTPLEGLPMATRSGSVDPGLLLHLLRGGMSVDTLEQTLEYRSGLLGISGLSADVRDLLAAHDNPDALLALEVLGWRLRSSLGAMLATLGGADLVVFTGGIGEHVPEVRLAALQGGLGAGVMLDKYRNARATHGDARIDLDSGRVAVCVVTAREGWQLARAALQAL